MAKAINVVENRSNGLNEFYVVSNNTAKILEKHKYLGGYLHYDVLIYEDNLPYNKKWTYKGIIFNPATLATVLRDLEKVFLVSSEVLKEDFI